MQVPFELKLIDSRTVQLFERLLFVNHYGFVHISVFKPIWTPEINGIVDTVYVT